MDNEIVIEIDVKVNLSQAWKYWNTPEHIIEWNYASDDWHCTQSECDVKVGGSFSSRMEAKDGSIGFDFDGQYTLVDEPNELHYTLGDGRKVEVKFAKSDLGTKITERFEPDTMNAPEVQKQGWLAILSNFKEYAESIGS